MQQSDYLKEIMENVIQKAETSELASSQDVINQLMQLLQK
ncbi:hypothetical protein SAMN05421687_102353 [Salimicrobium flavidum]|uniref:Uncharacterized protein n=1 Tax=Salimicrobium flavidum TaxID=570947 RepID=A0A1N7IWC5_9BACI|nr:hypothetical protein SAMN05421687_102353 [Salimicrobium flavidum]